MPDMIFGRNPKDATSPGLLHIGYKDDDRVLIDASFPHVIYISGSRGGGKSYTLGTIVEELQRMKIGVGVVVVDPVGVFYSIKQPNHAPKEVEILKGHKLEPNGVEDATILTPKGVFKPGAGVDAPFSIAVKDMTVDDWCNVFKLNRFATQGLLIGETIEKMLGGYTVQFNGESIDIPPRSTFSISDMILCIEYDASITSRNEGYSTNTRRSVVARLKSAKGWGIFSLYGTPLSELSRPDHVTVIDVANPKIGDSRRSLIVGILARKILDARIKATTGDNPEVDIPPTWMVVDEAHLLIPSGHKTAATVPLVEYVKLGRKPGCGLVFATQRPAATSDDVVSQVDMVIGHGLMLDDDVKAFIKRVPSDLSDEMKTASYFRTIKVGKGLMADQKSGRSAIEITIRPRYSHHGGAAPSLTTPGSQPRSPTTDHQPNHRSFRFEEDLFSKYVKRVSEIGGD